MTGPVDARAVVKAIGVTRIVLGTTFLLAPGPALRLWPGRGGSTDVDQALAHLLARSTGGRDVALGLGALLAAKHDGPLRGWVEAGALADAADAVAIVAGFRHLPRGRAVAMLFAAVGTAAAGRALVASLG